MHKISIVTPCYYNEKNLDDTYQAILEKVFLACPQYEWEWILVDDGSGDRTLETARRLQERDGRIRVVKLTRNFGEFRAVVAGMSVAEGDAVAVICADLQDPPELIPEMLGSWEQGNPVNLAVRRERDGKGLKNWFADSYYKLVRKWVIPDYPKRGFDFFLIDKTVADHLVRMQEKNSSVYLQLIWLGYKPVMIEYDRQEREKGQSMWTLSKRLNLFVDTFVVFSHNPIRMLTLCGAGIGVLGFILAVCVVVDKIVNGAPAGWASVMLVVLLTSAFQMIMMGVLGEYIWRNLDESRKRPLYVIEKLYGHSGEHDSEKNPEKHSDPEDGKENRGE